MAIIGIAAIRKISKDIDKIDDELDALQNRQMEHANKMKKDEELRNAELVQGLDRLNRDVQLEEQQLQIKIVDLQQQLIQHRDSLGALRAKAEVDGQNIRQRFENAPEELIVEGQKISDEIKQKQKQREEMDGRYSNVVYSDRQTPGPEQPPEDSISVNPSFSTRDPYPSPPRTDDDTHKHQRDMEEQSDIEYMKHFSHVICVNNEWRETRCYICDANAKQNGRGFFEGWNGLRAHYRRAHRAETAGKSDREMLNASMGRLFNAADVKRMKTGYEPQDGPIQKKSGQKVQFQEKALPQKGRGQDCSGSENATSEYDEDDNDEPSIPRSRYRQAKLSSQKDLSKDTAEQGRQKTHANGKVESDMTENAQEDRLKPPGNIIRTRDDCWIRIRCKTCGANADPATQNYFRGHDGIRTHLQVFHSVKLPMDAQDKSILDHLSWETMSKQQVHEVIRGELPNSELEYPPVGRLPGIRVSMMGPPPRPGLNPPASADPANRVPMGPPPLPPKAAPASSSNAATAKSPLETGVQVATLGSKRTSAPEQTAPNKRRRT